MGKFSIFLKHIVTAFWLWGIFYTPAVAEAQNLDSLMAALKVADDGQWQGIETQIRARWSRSGSAAMDVLLKRGRDAIEAGDFTAAIDHLGALVDHAPDFAEGYAARARAYFQAGYYGPALADIRHVLATNPRQFDALMGLAAILEEMNQPGKALAVYRRVLFLHPHKPDALQAVQRLNKMIEGRAL